MDPTTRLLARGGALGPIAFITAWVVGSISLTDYSAVDDAISRLAAPGASTAGLMTAGFVAYAVAMGAFAVALHRIGGTVAAVVVSINAAATVGVAVWPVDVADAAHGVAALVGYLSLAVIPLTTVGLHAVWGPLPPSTQRTRAVALGVLILAALAVGAAAPGMNGLWQRIGLVLGDGFLIGAAVQIVTAVQPAGVPSKKSEYRLGA